jgi:hypothetical protein
MKTEPEETPERGRPPAEAPAHYVSMSDAVRITGVAYATVYRHVMSGKVRSRQEDNGVRFVLRSDLPKIQKTVRVADGDRHAVMLRPERERFDRWAIAAKKAGHEDRVSSWLAELADRAAR